MNAPRDESIRTGPRRGHRRRGVLGQRNRAGCGQRSLGRDRAGGDAGVVVVAGTQIALHRQPRRVAVGGLRVGVALLPAVLAIALFDQGALLEEVGWRGLAQPEMQRHGSPLSAAMIVGVAWGLWHLPRDITTGVIERLGYVDYALLFLPSFVLGTVAVSVIAAFFMNRLGGSIIPAIIIHGLTNDAVGLSGGASISEALTPYHQITKNLPFAVIAAGIVWFSGRELGYRSS